MRKLKATEVGAFREERLAAQNGRCAICKLPCSSTQAVADHDHATGVMRGTLHRGCNALLGKIENNHKRYGVPNVHAFTNGVASYLMAHAFPATELLHPTHKTPDEKRVARNAKARKTRAAAKKEP